MARNFIDNMVFFGDKGLSSAAADHYAHIAEDIIMFRTGKINSVNLVETSVSLLDSNNPPVVTKKGMTESELEEIINSDIVAVADMHSFVAWVREALKTKVGLTSKVASTSLMTYVCDVLGEKEEWEKCNESYSTHLPDKDERDMLDDMTADELYDYLMMETHCAEFGKFVVDGALRRAGKEIQRVQTEPMSTRGEGKDTMITSYKATVSPEYFTTIMGETQGYYRKLQSRLNKVKFAMREKADQLNEFTRQMNMKEQSERKAKLDVWQNQYNSWRVKELRRLSDLKIYIPGKLQQIYQTLLKAEKGEIEKQDI